MREFSFLQAIGSIDDDLVVSAAVPPRAAQSRRWKPLLAAAACLVLICTLLLPRSPAASDAGAAAGESESSAPLGDESSDAVDGCATFSFTPVLWYGGRGYEWHDVTHVPGEDEGWIAAGKIAGVSAQEDAVLDDLWLCADFEAAGTVYTSTEYPDMLYVSMTTLWLEEVYVCFMIPPLAWQPMICFEGQIYCPAAHSNPDIKAGTTLPAGFSEAGAVTKATFGKVPDESGETTGWYNGCTVYASPEDQSILYLGAYRNSSSGVEYIYAPATLLTQELAGELTIPEALLPAN